MFQQSWNLVATLLVFLGASSCVSSYEQAVLKPGGAHLGRRARHSKREDRALKSPSSLIRREGDREGGVAASSPAAVSTVASESEQCQYKQCGLDNDECCSFDSSEHECVEVNEPIESDVLTIGFTMKADDTVGKHIIRSSELESDGHFQVYLYDGSLVVKVHGNDPEEQQFTLPALSDGGEQEIMINYDATQKFVQLIVGGTIEETKVYCHADNAKTGQGKLGCNQKTSSGLSDVELDKFEGTIKNFYMVAMAAHDDLDWQKLLAEHEKHCSGTGSGGEEDDEDDDEDEDVDGPTAADVASKVSSKLDDKAADTPDVDVSSDDDLNPDAYTNSADDSKAGVSSNNREDRDAYTNNEIDSKAAVSSNNRENHDAYTNNGANPADAVAAADAAADAVSKNVVGDLSGSYMQSLMTNVRDGWCRPWKEGTSVVVNREKCNPEKNACETGISYFPQNWEISDDGSSRSLTMQECWDKCLADEACEQAVFRTNNGECWLGVNSLTEDPNDAGVANFTSGCTTCEDVCFARNGYAHTINYEIRSGRCEPSSWREGYALDDGGKPKLADCVHGSLAVADEKKCSHWGSEFDLSERGCFAKCDRRKSCMVAVYSNKSTADGRHEYNCWIGLDNITTNPGTALNPKKGWDNHCATCQDSCYAKHGFPERTVVNTILNTIT